MAREVEVVGRDIRVKEVSAQPVLGIRATTPMSQIGELIGRAFGEMFGYLGEVEVMPAGPPVAIYHTSESMEEDMDVEICVPVAGTVVARGRMNFGEIPAGTVACTLHVGPYSEIGAVYRDLVEWIEQHGHETAGPPREVYIVGPGMTSDESEYRTEVAWPIRPR
jgi:effector-binding domain-containing protein